MASDEDLKAMGILTEKCSVCHKKITSQEYIENGGMCANCINKFEESLGVTEERKKELNSNNTNIVAITIKVLSIISAIIGVILGIIIFEDFEVYAVGFITVILISCLFVYAIGEIIQKLQNIEENTRK